MTAAPSARLRPLEYPLRQRPLPAPLDVARLTPERARAIFSPQSELQPRTTRAIQRQHEIEPPETFRARRERCEHTRAHRVADRRRLTERHITRPHAPSLREQRDPRIRVAAHVAQDPPLLEPRDRALSPRQLGARIAAHAASRLSERQLERCALTPPATEFAAHDRRVPRMRLEVPRRATARQDVIPAIVIVTLPSLA